MIAKMHLRLKNSSFLCALALLVVYFSLGVSSSAQTQSPPAGTAQPHPVQTNPILTNPVQTNPAQTNPAQANPILTNPAPPHAAASASTPDQGTFPAVEATSLNKAHFNLPRDFGGELNLVIISFAREQQQDVDSWLPAARQLEAQHARLYYYELPTTARENLLYRWWFNSALRSNNTDPVLEDRTLTLYVSKGQFLQSLKIPNEKQIVAMLVNRSGQVLWRANGAFTAEKNQSLTTAVTANGM
ncbi:MAG TPA: hypothetical protein VHX63_16860 [Acidobacteriaceae bacterium]|jgi:hypothetical protein|nr:hypothetical protein [Acidobacteriaceae bacterium]